MAHELLELLTVRILSEPNFSLSREFCLCVGVQNDIGTDWLEVDFTDVPSLDLVDLPSGNADVIVRLSEAQADALTAGHMPESFSDAEIEGDAELIAAFFKKLALSPGAINVRS